MLLRPGAHALPPPRPRSLQKPELEAWPAAGFQKQEAPPPKRRWSAASHRKRGPCCVHVRAHPHPHLVRVGDWPSPVRWTLGSMDGLLTSVREGPGLRRRKAGRHSGRGGIACGAGRTLKLCLQRVAMAPGVISRLWWLSEGPWGSVGFRLIFVAFYAPYTVSLELWGETLRTLAFFVCLYG